MSTKPKTHPSKSKLSVKKETLRKLGTLTPEQLRQAAGGLAPTRPTKL